MLVEWQSKMSNLPRVHGILGLQCTPFYNEIAFYTTEPLKGLGHANVP